MNHVELVKLSLKKKLLPFFLTLAKRYIGLCVLGYVLEPFSKLQFIIRYFSLYYCAIYQLVVLGSIGLVLPLLGLQKYVAYCAAAFYRVTASPIGGIHFHVEGREHLERLEKDPGILVMNHQSEIDCLALGHWFPINTTIAVKKSLFFIPGFGQYLRGIRAIPIDRKKGQSALESLRTMSRRMREEGLSLCIFPEGTRRSSEDFELQKFKLGAFLTALPEKLPVIPVVVQNYSQGFYPKAGRFQGGTFKIKILPPVDSGKYAATHEGAFEMSQDVRKKMQEVYREMGSAPM